jgi:hypothetical protein
MVSQGFQVGGGGFDECPNLLNAFNGPRQLPIGSSSETSGCDNIEDTDE